MTALPQTDGPPQTAGLTLAVDRMTLLGHGAVLPDAPGSPVHELVAAVAAARPDAVAVECDGQALTYADLDSRAALVAGRLQAAGIGLGARVGVLLEPSAVMVAAVLGVLRAGAAYVPLDPAHPDGRLSALLRDADVGGLVVAGASTVRAAAFGLPLVDAGEVPDGRRCAEAPPCARVTAADAAYVIYTSGSTGEPKGVLVEHGQLAASTLARHIVYPGRATFLLVSPLAFDSSAAGLWGTLTAGGRLVVATAEEIRDPGRLVELVHRHRVERILCVPGLYGVLLDAAVRVGVESLRTLDTVIVAGEALPAELVRRHVALRGAAAALVNEYGPSEATVWSSYQRVCGPGAPRSQPITIGGPVPGVRLYVLDERGRPTPLGSEGELFVGGALVARGYVGRQEETDRVFLSDPFAGVEGARMYRTGDRVRWTGDRTLEFLGRRDNQVKIRGHRVELGAVEAALRATPGVRDAVVVTDHTGDRLLGFVLASPAVVVLAEELRKRLARVLPAVMVPGHIEVLNRFPTTVNGKVDRTALSRSGVSAPRTPSRSPRSHLDGPSAAVAAAWGEVLDLVDVPTGVNFFDLGGNSLSMFALQDALERHTGSRPSTITLFRYTTVAEQASLIRDGGGGPDESRGDMVAASARRAAAIRARRARAAR